MNKVQTKEELEEDIKNKKLNGINSDEYILDLLFDDTIKDYQCMICMSLIKNATEIKTCGHIFCQYCIYKWYETSNTCPLCKVDIDEEDLVESKFIDRKVSQINVTCSYCDWKGNFFDFIKHTDSSYKSPCQYILVACNECNKNIKYESLEQHKIESCEYRLIQCIQCNIKIKSNELKYHIENTCLESNILSCNDKCDFKGKRSEYIIHIDQCPYEKIICPLNYMGCCDMIERNLVDQHMVNALQSHFLIAEDRIKYLEIENKNLKIKLINYEPIDPKHILVKGDMIKYKRHGHWIFCTITDIIETEYSEFLKLETDEGEFIEVSRYSDRLRLLQ